MRSLPTAPFAAASLVAGWAVVAATGSRPLGGVALLLCGAITVWLAAVRRGARAAARLAVAGFAAFVLSHVLGLLAGAWPAVLLTAAALGAYAWVAVDSRNGARRRQPAFER
ncbi:MAG TPA: hypothetical protein VHT27_05185 [Solirubrobacteraceae bacterium]|jgi:D-arabinose 1-dehydrogenase-like Zn-dependent alcohol dehydrogenase|nr:hypothetical protein [Solirubrobacteraceae bacterium]